MKLWDNGYAALGVIISGSWLEKKANLFVALMSYNPAMGVRTQTSGLLEEAVITQHLGWGTLSSLGK